MSEAPGIEVPDVKLIVCRRHGEPLRPEWPRGYATVALAMVRAVLEDPEMLELSGGKVERIEALIPEFAPLCGRYPKALRAALGDARIGRRAACHGGCRRRRAYGCAYAARQPDGRVQTRHVCFDCVVAMPCEASA